MSQGSYVATRLTCSDTFNDHFIISSACVIFSCIQNIFKSYKRILMKFCLEVERGPEKNLLDFRGDPGSFVDPGYFPGLFYH